MKATYQNEEKDNKVGSKEPSKQLWIRRGESDIEYQRQAQVTWWSILGGLAVGVLLTQFPAIIENLNRAHWQLFLYFFASALFIILNWVNISWGSLVLRARLSIARSITTFFTGFSLSLLCLLVTKPSVWAFGVAFWILCGMAQDFVEFRMGVTLKSIWHEKKAFSNQVIQMGVFLFIAIFFGICLFLFPSQLLELIFILIVIAAAIFSFFSQHQIMERERKEGNIP